MPDQDMNKSKGMLDLDWFWRKMDQSGSMLAGYDIEAEMIRLFAILHQSSYQLSVPSLWEELQQELGLTQQYAKQLVESNFSVDFHPPILLFGMGEQYPFHLYGHAHEVIEDRIVTDEHGNTLFAIKSETIRFLRDYVYGWPEVKPQLEQTSSFNGKRPRKLRPNR